MKWAKVTEPSPPLSKGSFCREMRDKNEENCYTPFESLESLEKQMVKDENLWCQYQFEFDFTCEEKERNKKLEKDSPAEFKKLIEKAADVNFLSFQKRYELYCGGFLQFYDQVVRRRTIDHTVYMKWFDMGKGKERNLYAVRFYLSPAPARYKPYGQRATNGLSSKEKSGTNFLTSDTSDDMGTDPPPPPPPPPPTMH